MAQPITPAPITTASTAMACSFRCRLQSPSSEEGSSTSLESGSDGFPALGVGGADGGVHGGLGAEASLEVRILLGIDATAENGVDEAAEHAEDGVGGAIGRFGRQGNVFPPAAVLEP